MPRQIMIKILLITLFILNQSKAWCYSEDVHFNLTCALCRIASIPLSKCHIIAVADQSMDENHTTTAYDGLSTPILLYVENGRKWHAFSDDKSPRQTVENRLKYLETRAFDSHIKDGDEAIICDSKINDQFNLTKHELCQLVKFGQYLHFLQDYYAHRQTNGRELTKEAWTPYGPVIGHLLERDQPDAVAMRVPLAKQMARDCYKSICRFATEVLKVTPSLQVDQVTDVTIENVKIDKLVDVLASAYTLVDAKTPLPSSPVRSGNAPPPVVLHYWAFPPKYITREFPKGGNPMSAARVLKIALDDMNDLRVSTPAFYYLNNGRSFYYREIGFALNKAHTDPSEFALGTATYDKKGDLEMQDPKDRTKLSPFIQNIKERGPLLFGSW